MSEEPKDSNDVPRILEYSSPPIKFEEESSLSKTAAIWFGSFSFLLSLAAGGIELVILARRPIEDGTMFPSGGAELCILGAVLVFVACRIRVRKSNTYSMSKSWTAVASLIFVFVMLLLFFYAYRDEGNALLATIVWGLLYPWAVPWLALRVGRTKL